MYYVDHNAELAKICLILKIELLTMLEIDNIKRVKRTRKVNI